MLPRLGLLFCAPLLLFALACEGRQTPAVGSERAVAPGSDDSPRVPPEPTPAPLELTLCQRLDAERSALDLGAPLHARVVSFEERARAWLTRADVSPAVRDALGALALDPTSRPALAALHDSRAEFTEDPPLLADATLVGLVAADAAPPRESNAHVRALLAQARGWLPGEPSVPWIEALLVPERGGRRALLDEAFAAGARDPALLLALARAAMREGDAAAALTALDALPTAVGGAASGAALGVALRERAEATQRARALLHRSDLVGIEVWAGSSLSTDVSVQLARAVRADLDAAARLLRGPARPRLVVWVHASLDAFNASTCGTSWSRALYDGVLHIVVVGDPLDPALLRSVRHEALHAQLDFLTPLAPRWLQEGVAQRFAQEPFRHDATSQATPVSAPALRVIDQDLALANDGATAGSAYVRARLAIEQLVARAGEDALPRAVTALRDGIPPGVLPEYLGFAP